MCTDTVDDEVAAVVDDSIAIIWKSRRTTKRNMMLRVGCRQGKISQRQAKD